MAMQIMIKLQCIPSFRRLQCIHSFRRFATYRYGVRARGLGASRSNHMTTVGRRVTAFIAFWAITRDTPPARPLVLLRQPIISVARLAPNRNPFHDRLRYDCRPRPFYGWKWKVSEPHLHIRGLGCRHLGQGLLPTTATSKIGCTECVVEHKIVHI